MNSKYFPLIMVVMVTSIATLSRFALLSMACPAECRCHAASQSVLCNSVSNAFNSYVSSIPAWVSSIILICQPQLSNAGRPLPTGHSLSALGPGLLRRFGDLREFTIRCCPIASLPAEFFAYLPQLESVTLDTIPLNSLPPGLFRGSRKLRDVVILRSPEYRVQPRGLFSDNPGLRQFKLVETGINGEAVENLLASAASDAALIDLEIKVTANPPLTLTKDAFSRFNLTRLSLSNNGILSFDFLPSVGASAVTLAYNPVPFGRLSLVSIGSEPVPNSMVTSLHLEHMDLYEIPEGLASVFPNLVELHAATNVISELAADRLENLSKLVKIDLSGNQIQSLSNWKRLQPLLSSILYRDRVGGRIYIAENPMHCNCELGWIYDTPILGNSLFKDLTCRTGQFQGQLLTTVQRHQLRCRKQQTPAIVVVGGNWSGNATEYDGLPVSISEGQNVTLTCSSSGDPAPSLFWRLQGVSDPPQELIRSKSNKDYAVERAELVLVVAHGTLPSGRHQFQCAARSSYFVSDELSVTVTLLISMATGTPTTSPNRDGIVGPSVGRSDALQQDCKLLWLTLLLLHQLMRTELL